MTIKKLQPDVLSSLRSDVTITTAPQCVTDLVLNSIDAGATSVAVRVDLNLFKLQVIDNGCGLTLKDLDHIGIRYMTSKCHSLKDLQSNLDHFGFRGEALASLKEVSGTLLVISRPRGCNDTFCKMFTQGNPQQACVSSRERPSPGTTIQVGDFLYNRLVRRARIRPAVELEEIKMQMECTALVNPQVSFSLRNDATGEVIMQSSKGVDCVRTFSNLFGEDLARHLVSVCASSGALKVTGFISKEAHSLKNRQFIYINKRLLIKTKLHKLVNSILSRSSIIKSNNGPYIPISKEINHSVFLAFPPPKRDKHAVFMLNIICPHSEYDITLDPKKTLIEFQDWDNVLSCIENVVRKFIEQQSGVEMPDEVLPSTPQGRRLSIMDEVNMLAREQELGAEVLGTVREISTKDISRAVHTLPLHRNTVKISNMPCESNQFTSSSDYQLCSSAQPGISSAASEDPYPTPIRINRTSSIVNPDVNKKTILTDTEESLFSSGIQKKKITMMKYRSLFAEPKLLTSKVKEVMMNRPPVSSGIHFNDNFRKMAARLPGFELDESPASPINPLASIKEIRKKTYLKSLSKFSYKMTNDKQQLLKSGLISSTIKAPMKDPVPEIDAKSAEVQTSEVKNVLQESKAIQTTPLLETLCSSHPAMLFSHSTGTQSNVWNINRENVAKTSSPQSVGTNERMDNSLNSDSCSITGDDKNSVSSDSKHTRSSFQSSTQPKRNLSSESQQWCAFSLSNFLHSEIKGKRFQHLPLDKGAGSSDRWSPEVEEQSELEESGVNSSSCSEFNDVKNSFQDICSQKTKLCYYESPVCSWGIENTVANQQRHNCKSYNQGAEVGESQNIVNASLSVFGNIRNDKIRIHSEQRSPSPVRRLVDYDSSSSSPLQLSSASASCDDDDILEERKKRTLERAGLSWEFPKRQCLSSNISLSPTYSPCFSDASTLIMPSPQPNSEPVENEVQGVSERTGVNHGHCDAVDICVDDPSLAATPAKGQRGKKNTERYDNIVKMIKVSEKSEHELLERDVETSNEANCPSGTKNTGSDSIKSCQWSTSSTMDCALVNAYGSVMADNTDLPVDNVSQREKVSCINETHSMLDILPSSSHRAECAALTHSKKLSISGSSADVLLDPKSGDVQGDDKQSNNVINSTEPNSIKSYQWSIDSTMDNELVNALETVMNKSTDLPSTEALQKEYMPLINKLCDMQDINSQLPAPSLHGPECATFSYETLLSTARPPADVSLDIQPSNIQEEWWEQRDYSGKAFFIHRKSGVTMYQKPQTGSEQSTFAMTDRYSFLPKGMSPILEEPQKGTERNLKALNAEKKQELLSALIKCCDSDELSTIKWQQKLSDDVDKPWPLVDQWLEQAKKHRELVSIEPQIASATVQEFSKSDVKVYNALYPCTFSKDIFTRLRVLGQLDNKFIVTVVSMKFQKEYSDVLVLFDQHAVHERIRVENLTKEYRHHDGSAIWRSAPVDPALPLSVSASEVRVLDSFKEKMKRLGLTYEVLDSHTISVQRVPTCLLLRENREIQSRGESVLKQHLESLIREQVDSLLTTRGAGMEQPSIIRNVISSEACRGAVKFGHPLSIPDCQAFLHNLSSCDLPFQCAHGRPSLVPIADLSHLPQKPPKPRPNLRKLKRDIVPSVTK